MHRAACLLGLLATLAVPAAARDVPFLAGRVVDEADLLPAAEEQRLTATLAALEEQKGAQVVVLTVPDLGGDPIEDFAIRVAETWRLGRAGVDDGVLFLVARDERRMRLEVGYGLEGAIPDATAGRILDEQVAPRFREGDYASGIASGVDAIAAAVRGEALPEPPVPAGRALGAEPLPMRLALLAGFFLFMIPFVGSALFARGCAGWFLFLFLLPFFLSFPIALVGPVGAFAGVAWIVLFPLARLWFGRSAAGRAFRERPALKRWGLGGGGFSGGGGGFSGGGGGGFSGGGGSFGGGGASSSW